jgi:hypothetical protein
MRYALAVSPGAKKLENSSLAGYVQCDASIQHIVERRPRKRSIRRAFTVGAAVWFGLDEI